MSEANGADTSAAVQPVTANVTPPTNGAKAAPPPEVNGKEPVPESILQMKKAAHLKFDEATKIRKEAEAMKAEAEAIRAEAMSSKGNIEKFIEMANTNPRALVEIYGAEAAKKIAEELLYSFYEEEKLTPEQLEARKQRELEKAELEEYRSMKKKQKEDEQKTAREKLVSEQGQRIDAEIANAIKEYGLPPTPMVVKRLARYLEAQLESDMDIDVSRVLPKVHEELHNEAVGYIKDMPIEQLVEEFPSLIKKVREFDMKQNASVPSFQTGFKPPQAESEDRKQKKSVTIDEFFKRIG